VNGPFAQEAALRTALPNFVSIGRQEAHREPPSARLSSSSLKGPSKWQTSPAGLASLRRSAF
jgi:hypothetical protein